jgi:hypothetical protein
MHEKRDNHNFGQANPEKVYDIKNIDKAYDKL